MPRNSSGTYSLAEPAFIAGTTILSASVNSDFSDIATALTESLATTGVSSMTGPIKAAAGTVGAPSYTFASDTDTGIYSVGVNAFSMVCGGAAVLALATTGAVLTGTLGVTGNVHFLGTLVVDGGVSFGAISASDATTPLIVINTTNDAAEHVLELYELGTGVGVHASLRAKGTGANDLSTLLLYFDSTKVLTYTSTIITSAIDLAVGASFTQAAADYSQFLEIAAPGAGAANTARLYAVDEATVTRLQFVDAGGNLTTIYPVTTQAIQETGTANTSFVSPGTQKYNPLHPKAWVVYNLATQTILASSNISGVVRDSAGIFTVTFSTAFSSANYGVTGAASNNPGGSNSVDVVTPLAATCQLRVADNNNAVRDVTYVCAVFFGDLP